MTDTENAESEVLRAIAELERDAIDDLVDVQLRQTPSGYDYNLNQPKCPHPWCDADFHGLPITQKMRWMRSWGGVEPGYVYEDDDSPVICPGSAFEGEFAPPTSSGRGVPDMASALAASIDEALAANTIAGLFGYVPQQTAPRRGQRLICGQLDSWNLIAARIVCVDTAPSWPGEGGLISPAPQPRPDAPSWWINPDVDPLMLMASGDTTLHLLREPLSSARAAYDLPRRSDGGPSWRWVESEQPGRRGLVVWNRGSLPSPFGTWEPLHLTLTEDQVTELAGRRAHFAVTVEVLSDRGFRDHVQEQVAHGFRHNLRCGLPHCGEWMHDNDITITSVEDRMRDVVEYEARWQPSTNQAVLIDGPSAGMLVRYDGVKSVIEVGDGTESALYKRDGFDTEARRWRFRHHDAPIDDPESTPSQRAESVLDQLRNHVYTHPAVPEGQVFVLPPYPDANSMLSILGASGIPVAPSLDSLTETCRQIRAAMQPAVDALASAFADISTAAQGFGRSLEQALSDPDPVEPPVNRRERRGHRQSRQPMWTRSFGRRGRNS